MIQLIFVILTSYVANKPINTTFSSDCSIKSFYQAIEADYGVKVLTTFGTLEDADIILSPIKMDAGDYKVNVTRKANDLYKIEGTSYYIETNYCYEYSFSSEAILSIESQYGYTKGKLIFK